MTDDIIGPEAKIRYGDADFEILRNGAYVRCAVTGRHIPIQELRYWNPKLQEPYADAVAALQRWRELNQGKAE